MACLAVADRGAVVVLGCLFAVVFVGCCRWLAFGQVVVVGLSFVAL